jgi:hypothetical protein
MVDGLALGKGSLHINVQRHALAVMVDEEPTRRSK